MFSPSVGDDANIVPHDTTKDTDCHGGADKTLLLAMTEWGNGIAIKYSVVSY